MKTEEEYRLSEIRRVGAIKENADYSHEPELVKLMEGVVEDGFSRLIEKSIILNDLEKIKKEINESKVSVTERNLDLLWEFLSLNNENINKLDEYWLEEFKRFGKGVLFRNIELKEGYENLKKKSVQDKYSLFLKSFQLLNNPI